MKALFSLFFLSFACSAFSQKIDSLTGGRQVSLRGLSVVSDSIIWASGSSGTVARSVNGGKTFVWLTVKGYETRDFRDIEAFDENTAVISGIAEPAVILKTKDGGQTWTTVFEDTTKGMFLDAMDFNGRDGVVVGDPVDGKAFIAMTSDAGDHWRTVADDRYELQKDEAFFASSGTNVILMRSGKKAPFPVLVTGGSQSRFFGLGYPVMLPLVNGKNTTGANSIACFNQQNCVVVGGDFTNVPDTTGNCVLTTDGGNSWHKPVTPPHGYKSCVVFLSKTKLIASGTSGVDLSTDGGRNWSAVSPESYHVCQKAKNGTAVFLAGSKGRIAKLVE